MTAETAPVDVAAIRARVEIDHVYEGDGDVLDQVCSCGGGGPCPDREDLLTLAARVEQLDNALRSANSAERNRLRDELADLQSRFGLPPGYVAQQHPDRADAGG